MGRVLGGSVAAMFKEQNSMEAIGWGGGSERERIGSEAAWGWSWGFRGCGRTSALTQRQTGRA